MSDYRPIIGVSGELQDTKSVSNMMMRLVEMGADPLFLGSPGSRDPHADIQKLDGLMIMGSNFDVPPVEYGDDTIHAQTKLDPSYNKRGHYENQMIELALFHGVPLLGICAGMHRINISNHEKEGGTLHQHMPDITGQNHWQSAPGFDGDQEIIVEPGSRLDKLTPGYGSRMNAPIAMDEDGNVPGETVLENQLHHQGIKDVRKGFVVSALSDEGIIEAIEPDPNGPYADNYVFGVQWHPEFIASELSENLIQDVINHARGFGKDKQAKLANGHSAAVKNGTVDKEPQR